MKDIIKSVGKRDILLYYNLIAKKAKNFVK